MTSIRDLAREIADIRELALGGERIPQLAHSSIENGALDVNDQAGNLTAAFGLQYDGASMAASLNGPTPPTPTAAITTGGAGQAVIGWDGFFADDPMTVAPTDWSRAEIHASRNQFFAADTVATLRDTFESPRGGEKTIGLPSGTWYVKLVARTLSGKRSEPSVATVVEVAELVTSADLDLYGDRIAANEATLATAQQRLDSTEVELDDLFGKADAVPGQISAAAAAAEASALAAALASAKSYVNPGTSVTGIRRSSGVDPVIVDSPTAMGGKALQKTGAGHGWWEDRRSLQAIDPTVLYRVTARVRVVTPSTSESTHLFYFGAVGFADGAGGVYVNAAGANSASSQQWTTQAAVVPQTGAWVDYVGYYRGIAASGNGGGAGTLAAPKVFHSATKYFCAGLILDYNSGNGVWELSHLTVEAIDAVGQQALSDAATKSAQALTDAKADATTKANQAKTDAINAAAADATTKADAAKALATTAQTAADQAIADALAASGLAGTKGEVIVQTSAPTGTRAVAQNLWIRLPDNKPHRWNPASTATNKWEAVTDQAATDAAAAAVTAQSKADTAAAAAATAQSRADAAYTLAGTANTTADAALASANGKNKVYRSTSAPSGSGSTHGDIWFQFSSTAYTTVIGQWTWSATAATPAWQKNTLSHQTISSVDIGSLSVIGTGTFKTAVADEIFAKIVKARTVEATEAFIGGNAILTGTVTAANIDTENFFAAQAVIDKLEGRMATYLTNEDGSGVRSTVTGQGLAVTKRTYDGLQLVDEQDLIRLGTFGPSYLAISDDAGEIAAAMGKDGAIVGRSLEVRDRLTLGGVDLDQRIGDMPQGMVAWGQVPINTSMVSNGEVGLFEIGWESSAVTGSPVQRMYEFNLNEFLIQTTRSDGVVGVRLRYTNNGDVPTINSDVIAYNYVQANSGFVTVNLTRIIGSNNGPYMRVLVSLFDSTSGVATVYTGSGQTHLFCTVKDLGATLPQTASATTGGGTPYSPTSTPAPTYTPPPVPKVTKTYTWEDTGVRSYLPNGATYAFNPGKGYQGLQPYTGNGNLRSMWSFGTGIQSTLSGASIEDIWAYFYFEHWYYAAGGTARIRLHGNSGLPSTYNGTGFGLNVSGWTRGSARWVRLPDSLYDGFKSGQFRGIGLEGDGTYQTYGIANNAAIRIKYTK